MSSQTCWNRKFDSSWSSLAGDCKLQRVKVRADIARRLSGPKQALTMFFFLGPGAHNNLCGLVSWYPGNKNILKHTLRIEGIEINHKFVAWFPASYPDLIHDYALTAWFKILLWKFHSFSNPQPDPTGNERTMQRHGWNFP